MTNLEQRRQSLIELIEWYRDEYHHSDWCHSEMISKVLIASDEELDCYEQVVDGWLE